MRKLSLVLLLVVISKQSFGQFYVGIKSSYGLGVDKQRLEQPGQISVLPSVTADSLKLVDNKASFGGGFVGGALLGYKVNSKFSVEFFGGLHRSNNIESSYSLASSLGAKGGMSASMVTLRPSVLFTIIEKKQLSFFTRWGLVYSTGSFNLTNSWQIGQNTIDQQVVYHGADGVGWQSGLGLNLKLRKRIKLVAELELVQLSVNPESAQLKLYTLNGKDQLPNLSTSEKETKFVKERPILGPIRQNEPFNSLCQKLPLNGFGIGIGLCYQLSKN